MWLLGISKTINIYDTIIIDFNTITIKVAKHLPFKHYKFITLNHFDI